MTTQSTQLGQTLRTVISEIGGLDASASEAAQQRQQNLTKPLGALGRLEELSIQLAGITGVLRPPLRPCRVIVCAGDHGVTEEGVSAYPADVTAQMVLNFLAGGAAINVLARTFGAEVTVVDVGVKGELPDHPRLVKAKIRPGTANFLHEPAMTRAEAVAAIEVGVRVAQAAIADGVRVLVTGDMGIGNTTASAAIAAALTGQPAVEVTGLGTGIGRAGWRHKVEVVARAIETHLPDEQDPLDVLSKVGGLEIGAIAGVVLAAAAAHIPVIIDGVIATAGAAIATRLAPAVRAFMIAGHQSLEPGHRVLLDYLDLRPLMSLDLRLGEGTGAMLALPLLDAAVALLNEMATFSDAGVSGPVE
ncbi:MAG TPA: nicotinate-nucleotide--dimethylbenzimidazole phosphoribosyltransferase [Chloroflexi bacterium]|nr:nicotinate-nucleotide--dimethylbenzimidazole phosphoribosyltransferase [Chloroflexota bacterium]HHW88743.1 nicotinate-nucleotide--dimethylbenzimidazole phosphoribosyltransferase [Chloroflexota bacterium]